MGKHLSDIEIARGCTLRPITEIAEKLGLTSDDLEQYGPYKAKVRAEAAEGRAQDGKLILVTAITPTPAGEGKTTTTVGLGQAFAKIGKNAVITLREPSLGPCLGIKGGAAGGGYSQVLPMEDINLHFTGDLHAITTAHNFLSAMVDNYLHHGGGPGLDPRRVEWRRVLDMNDRALRNVIVGLGKRSDGVPRETGFDITAASEIMAILCLADDMADLKARLSRIIVGYDYDRNPVTAGDLDCIGAMATLLKDAIKPNLVQTIEGTPAFVHGGPFANIAHGTNSVVADKLALKLADYVITEAGFGCDLGGEKFFHIMCRSAGLTPSCVAIVATARALKMHGGVPKTDLKAADPDAVARGLPNLEKHIDSIQRFNVPVLVCVNRFTSDTDEECQVIVDRCKALGVDVEVIDVWGEGGAGATKAAEKIAALADGFEGAFTPLYALDAPVKDKIRAVAQNVYGADDVQFTSTAEMHIRKIKRLGLSDLPVCMAKTQNSLSDNPKLLGRPSGFDITVREIVISAGAGFLVPITGTIMRMPGLAKRPAALGIDIDENGVIEGLS